MTDDRRARPRHRRRASRRSSRPARSRPAPAPGMHRDARSAPGGGQPCPLGHRRWASRGSPSRRVIAAVMLLGSRAGAGGAHVRPGDAAARRRGPPRTCPATRCRSSATSSPTSRASPTSRRSPRSWTSPSASCSSRASAGSVDYVTDVKPWLSGPAFLALARAPIHPHPARWASSPRRRSLTTTGTVSCETAFDGADVTTEAYRGVDLKLIGPERRVRVRHRRYAGAPRRPGVRSGGASTPTPTGTGMDQQRQLPAARGSLEGDQLATIYIDGHGLPRDARGPRRADPGHARRWRPSGWHSRRGRSQACAPRTTPRPRRWSAAHARDHGGASPARARLRYLPVPPGHASAIAPLAPAGTIVFVEGQGIGVGLQNTIAQFRSIPMYAPMLEMLDGLGGAERARRLDRGRRRRSSIDGDDRRDRRRGRRREGRRGRHGDASRP